MVMNKYRLTYKHLEQPLIGQRKIPTKLSKQNHSGYVIHLKVCPQMSLKENKFGTPILTFISYFI